MYAFHLVRSMSDSAARPTVGMSAKRNQLDQSLCDAISKLQTVAEHLVEGCFLAETRDREDHSFSGKRKNSLYFGAHRVNK